MHLFIDEGAIIGSLNFQILGLKWELSCTEFQNVGNVKGLCWSQCKEDSANHYLCC